MYRRSGKKDDSQGNFKLLFQDTRSCNCLTALCNFNWVTAGAEDKIKVGRDVTEKDYIILILVLQL